MAFIVEFKDKMKDRQLHEPLAAWFTSKPDPVCVAGVQSGKGDQSARLALEQVGWQAKALSAIMESEKPNPCG